MTPLPQFNEPTPVQEGRRPNRLLAELQTLRPQLLLPCSDLIATRWLVEGKWIIIFALGLFPLAVLAILQTAPALALSCLALYFSALWLFFFHQFFSLGEGTWKTALLTCLSTAVLVTILSVVGLEHWGDSLVYSSNVLMQIVGEVFLIAIPAYLCRIAVILFLLRPGATVPSLPAMVFYGLCSGLAMGMVEALDWELSNVGVDSGTFFFYSNAVLRLTTFAFMQAIWTGLAAYFFTLARMYPAHRLGLWAVAVALPLLLEIFHVVIPMSLNWLKLIVDFIATFLLVSYLFRRTEIEAALQTGN